ncbi:hypothetical protein MN030_003011 [Clostridium perfringens]
MIGKKIFALTTTLLLSISILGGVNTVAEEISNIPKDGLKGYWNFEESNGNIIMDSSGNNKNATIKGNGVIVNSGISNKGLKLTGQKGTFLSIPSILNMSNEDTTVSFWVNIDKETSDSRAENTILLQQEGLGRSILYYAPSNKGDKLGSFVGGSNIYASKPLAQGEWYNLTLVSRKDKKEIDFYINGELDSTHSIGTFPNSNDPLRIGDHKGNDGYALNGIIDEVLIYGRNLSDNEISNIYYENTTIESLKSKLENLLSEAKELQTLANGIIDSSLNERLENEIVLSEQFLENNNDNKEEGLNRINNLKQIIKEVNKFVNEELKDKVLISSDINNVFRTVDKALYGANHRYHNDGYGSYDSDNLKIKEEFDVLYDESSFGSIRYPGGKVANLFSWKRSIGDISERKHTIHGDPEQEPEFPYFGLDEAARYAEDKNSEFIYVYNMGNGSKEDAADLVEYLNCEVGENPNGGIDWAQVRADNGHPEPYRVTHFEMGNEFQLGEQGYWINNTRDRLASYIDGELINFTNQYVVEEEDWRINTSGKSNGNPNQKKEIRYYPIEEDTLVLKVGQETWTRVDSLENSDGGKVFEYDNSTGKITFGDGVKGDIPAENADIKVSYSSYRDGYVDYYEEMKKIDSDIKIYSSYDSHDFVRRMGTNKEYDGVVIHPYSGTINSSDSKYYEKILYRAEERVADVKAYEDLMKSILGEENSKDKKVVVSEYGMFRDDSRFVKSQVNAIYTAKSLIGFADISSVPYADKHCLIDFPEGDLLGPGQQAIIQSIVNKETGEIDFVATPTAKVFTLFNKMTGKHVLEENVINNKLLNIDGNRNLEAVETMVSKDDEGNIYLMMVNAAKEETDVRVQIKGFDFKGKSGNVMRVDGPSYDAENTVNNKNNVVVEEENLTPSKNSYLEYTLNPHSITAIKIIDAEFDYKLELQKEIKETKSLYDDSVEGFNVGEYHEGAKIKLNEALSNAQLVLEKENSTEEELIQSIKYLNLAKDIFNSFKIEEKTGDFNNNKKIDIGDLALVSRNYNSSNNQYDLNGDGLVGDYEIKFLNFRILN